MRQVTSTFRRYSSALSLALHFHQRSIFLSPVHAFYAVWSNVTPLSLVNTRRKRFRTSCLFLTSEEKRHSSLNKDFRLDDIRDVAEYGRHHLQRHFSFPIDAWQAQAGGEILAGRNAIVCAPTGAGKTVVGEMALHNAFEHDMNAIYTTPLKALSNQKFAELRKIFGPHNVGLSTGDMSINRGARITVMTTEVYRNMAWRASSSNEGNNRFENDLVSNSVVVLDEFHYMGQPGRGGVWEECVITSPSHTQIVGLSATLPNSGRLAAWMQSVTGRKTVLIEAIGGRPVPLRYFFARKDGIDYLFRDPDAGPGAPKGLMGLRGDGTPDFTSTQNTSRKGFQAREETKGSKLPKGLQLNPALKHVEQRRIEKIDRTVRRKSLGGESAQKRRVSEEPRSHERKMSPREEKRVRDWLLKQEMRKAVPSLPFIMNHLKQKNLLPAIFFIFSRAGCDEAAETVCDFMKAQAKVSRTGKSSEAMSSSDEEQGRKRKSRQRGRRRNDGNNSVFYSDDVTVVKDDTGRSFRVKSKLINDDTVSSIFGGPEPENHIEQNEVGLSSTDSASFENYAYLGLLNVQEVREVAAKVKGFNKDNNEIAFTEASIERFLLGVGSHHAGQLAAHKAFAESLFRSQLMKVVFATETLAAGINMPARTTVICSMAKRGDSNSMALLETSNLLQMAGRAGRRGMDIDGTCVIVATPFEGPEDAVSILTNCIKPIVSQFSPSYSLAVNLIARDAGKLNIARNLVQKSFAMWEKGQSQEALAFAKYSHGQDFEEIIEEAAQERYLEILKKAVAAKIEKSGHRPNGVLERILDALGNKDKLRKALKSFVSAQQILELEESTLKCLEIETKSATVEEIDVEDEINALFADEEGYAAAELEAQRRRVDRSQKEVSSHIFTAMAEVANAFMHGSFPEAKLLRAALVLTRLGDSEIPADSPVTSYELTEYAKFFVNRNRKPRKRDGLDTGLLVNHLVNAESTHDDSWEDMLALVRVLEAFGCLSPTLDTVDDPQSQVYVLTAAGENIGQLNFENSLWCLVAFGGAWDVAYASKGLDEFKTEMSEFASDNDDYNELFDIESVNAAQPCETPATKPQREAANLVSLIRSLDPSEMAGYVSCLVSEGPRGGGSSSSIVASFQSLSPTQQRVVQSSLLSLERLMEVQKLYSVDESSSRLQIELSNCEVVTAWAAGCSWQESLELSGAAPGDLARTLHRALDALRQVGNLPYNAARSMDTSVGNVLKVSTGIHPDIRRLCREAARSMDRYPVKDPLPFDEELADDEAAQEDLIDET